MITEHATCLFRPPPITECGQVVLAGPVSWQVAVMAVLLVGLCAMIAVPLIYHKQIRWGDDQHKEDK